jgi:hypothetical protein
VETCVGLGLMVLRRVEAQSDFTVMLPQERQRSY